MAMKIRPAMYWPTKVYLVDDDATFMSCLPISLSHERAVYETWTDPRACLIRLNAEFRPDPFEMNWVARGVEDDLEHRIMDVNVSSLHKEVYFHNRFEQISVIVVDYQMPGMNGVDFCASINNKNIRKILLTGIADAEIAIDALHKGIIDRYIPKQTKDLSRVLDAMIADLQIEYFRRLTADINRVVMLPPEDTALSDPNFIDFLEAHERRFDAVEYYLCEASGSFLFVNANGETSGLYVAFENVLDTILGLARDNDAPAHVIEALASRQNMLCYHNSDGYALPRGAHWDRHLFPVTKIVGRNTYYCAITPNIFDVDKSRILSFVSHVDPNEAKRASNRLETPLTSRHREMHILSF